MNFYLYFYILNMRLGDYDQLKVYEQLKICVQVFSLGLFVCCQLPVQISKHFNRVQGYLSFH